MPLVPPLPRRSNPMGKPFPTREINRMHIDNIFREKRKKFATPLLWLIAIFGIVTIGGMFTPLKDSTLFGYIVIVLWVMIGTSTGFLLWFDYYGKDRIRANLEQYDLREEVDKRLNSFRRRHGLPPNTRTTKTHDPFSISTDWDLSTDERIEQLTRQMEQRSKQLEQEMKMIDVDKIFGRTKDKRPKIQWPDPSEEEVEAETPTSTKKTIKDLTRNPLQ